MPDFIPGLELSRLHPEANLPGRTGFAGDEIGSAILAAGLVRDLMRLCFLMERQYAPYPKWFGKALSRLNGAAELSPLLWKILRAEGWPEREVALASAYERVATMRNALKITEPVEMKEHRLHDRPFKVIWGDFPGTLRAQIEGAAVKANGERSHIGSIDQFCDGATILLPTRWRPALRRLYEDETDR